MRVSDLKEMLGKLPEDTEVLVPHYETCDGHVVLQSYDEPCINTFLLYDGKLLIKGYDGNTAYSYKKRIINSEDVENNSIRLT